MSQERFKAVARSIAPSLRAFQFRNVMLPRSHELGQGTVDPGPISPASIAAAPDTVL